MSTKGPSIYGPLIPFSFFSDRQYLKESHILSFEFSVEPSKCQNTEDRAVPW